MNAMGLSRPATPKRFCSRFARPVKLRKNSTTKITPVFTCRLGVFVLASFLTTLQVVAQQPTPTPSSKQSNTPSTRDHRPHQFAPDRGPGAAPAQSDSQTREDLLRIIERQKEVISALKARVRALEESAQKAPADDANH